MACSKQLFKVIYCKYHAIIMHKGCSRTGTQDRQCINYTESKQISFPGLYIHSLQSYQQSKGFSPLAGLRNGSEWYASHMLLSGKWKDTYHYSATTIDQCSAYGNTNSWSLVKFLPRPFSQQLLIRYPVKEIASTEDKNVPDKPAKDAHRVNYYKVTRVGCLLILQSVFGAFAATCMSVQ